MARNSSSFLPRPFRRLGLLVIHHQPFTTMRDEISEALNDLFAEQKNAQKLAHTMPTRDQLLRLYHAQKLATNATRSTKSENRLKEVFAAAYGYNLGEHLAYKLIKVEAGNVVGWLLTLDTENEAIFWNSPKMDV